MSTRIDLINKRFGHLLVLSFAGLNKRTSALWLCRCDCGKEKVINGQSLRIGSTKSCGCISKEINSKIFRKKPFGCLYRIFIKVAQKKHLDNFISYDDFVLLTNITECHYCGSFINWTKYNTDVNNSAYHIDRKDNKKGYIFDNIVVCCVECNRAKGNRYSYEEWICMIEALKKYREKARCL